MSSWNKFQRLTSRERWLLIQALMLLPITALLLRLVGFSRCQSVLCGLAPSVELPSGNQTEELIRRANVTARMVRAVSWHGLYRGNCLQQSLVLWWLLRRQGIGSDLRIGVRKESGRLEAHAWVELMGITLNEPENIHHRFAAFDRPILPVGTDL